MNTVFPPILLQITSEAQEKLVFFIILGCIALFFLAAVFFLFSLGRRSHDHHKIHLPAMQETVRQVRREKEARTLSGEEVAAIATALAICTSEKPDAVFRVVSFRRVK